MSYIDRFGEMDKKMQKQELKSRIEKASEMLLSSKEAEKALGLEEYAPGSNGEFPERYDWDDWSDHDIEVTIKDYRVEDDCVIANFTWETEGCTHFPNGIETNDERQMVGEAEALIGDDGKPKFKIIFISVDGARPKHPGEPDAEEG